MATFCYDRSVCSHCAFHVQRRWNKKMENESVFPTNGSLSAEIPTFAIAVHTKIILYSIILVWSLVGNILVITVIFGNENLKTSFNYLIVNMAVSDLFMPVLTIPLKIVEEASGMPHRWFIGGAFGNAMCKLCFFLADISPAVSVFSLVIIAAKRFFAIVFPVPAQMFSKKKGWILISATWIIAMAIFSPHLYTFHLKTENSLTFCVNNEWALDQWTIFILIVTMVLFFIPFVTITVLYSVIMYKVHHGSKRVNNMLNNQQVRSRHQRNKQIFYTSVAIVLAFLILWGPFFSFFFVVSWIWRWNIPLAIETTKAVFFIVLFLGFLNTAVNPCIYFLFLRNYREGLKRLFRKAGAFRNNSEFQNFHMRTLRSNGRTMSGMISEDSCKLTNIKPTQL